MRRAEQYIRTEMSRALRKIARKWRENGFQFQPEDRQTRHWEIANQNRAGHHQRPLQRGKWVRIEYMLRVYSKGTPARQGASDQLETRRLVVCATIDFAYVVVF